MRGGVGGVAARVRKGEGEGEGMLQVGQRKVKIIVGKS